MSFQYYKFFPTGRIYESKKPGVEMGITLIIKPTQTLTIFCSVTLQFWTFWSKTIKTIKTKVEMLPLGEHNRSPVESEMGIALILLMPLNQKHPRKRYLASHGDRP